MDEITLTINDKQVKARKGMTVLEVAESAGIYIPTLCHHPDLEPYGGCRICLVEIEKVRGLHPACTYPASDGLIIHTDTEQVNQVRRVTLELLLSNHPHVCLTCSRRTSEECGNPFNVCLRNVSVTDRCVLCPANGHCELQKVIDYLGLHEMRLTHGEEVFETDTTHPFFDLDRNRCILCARCVRTCNEVTGCGSLALANRGNSMKVVTFGDRPFVESFCSSCGECMTRCPVGALIPKETRCPDQEVKTTCAYCGVGCQMHFGVKDGQVISVRGDRDNNVNRGKLCVKGRFGSTEYVAHPDRLSSPLIKRDGKFKETDWDTALNEVAKKLSKYLPEEVAVITSAKCTNEENYLLQKFARAVLGTHNIDHCARL